MNASSAAPRTRQRAVRSTSFPLAFVRDWLFGMPFWYTAAMPATPPLSSRSDGAFQALRREIIGGKAGPGLPLAEAAVAERLGVSRVPVREALFALEREGLVEFSRTGRA